jgi:hypothetical protein
MLILSACLLAGAQAGAQSTAPALVAVRPPTAAPAAARTD